VLVTGATAREARGGREIARRTAELWARDRTYLAAPRRVLQARDTALVVARSAISVVRRGGDGAWRYAIALLEDDHTKGRDDT